jgi:chromosome partitioning protein
LNPNVGSGTVRVAARSVLNGDFVSTDDTAPRGAGFATETETETQIETQIETETLAGLGVDTTIDTHGQSSEAVEPENEGQTEVRRPLPRVLAVANQKGGVGKTTTTVNMGAALAEMGLRVLLADLDPQGNASTGLGIENRGLERSMYHVMLHDEPLENVIEPTDVRNLFVAPASLDLAGAEIELVPAFSREQRLKRAIEAVIGDYDYVLIDCPPSLGLLTVNGLAAAREVLVPIQCDLEVSTILCVMYDARTKLSDQVVSEVRDHFGDKVLRSVIPRTVRLSEAPSFGQPITTFDSSSRGALAYRDAAKEVHRAAS